MNLQIFLNEFQNLLIKFPHLPSNIINSENCDLGDKIYYSKNLEYCFDCANCTDSTYLYDSYMCPNCVDGDYCVESELCYECVDAFKCYNCIFLDYCAHTRDSMFSYNCTNCHDVFGCANLQNKSFCIFNRQLTEQEYREKIRLYNVLPYEKIFQLFEEVKEKYPLTQTHEAHNENSQYGNYVHYSKNCYLCFDAGHNEDCSYMYDSFYNKVCYDGTYTGQRNELCYEAVDSNDIFNCNFVVFSQNCSESSYLFNCSNVKDSLGCVSLSNKQYCVLNRQLTKEQYQKIKEELYKEFRQNKTGWGELAFPI